jgi:deoxycytidine triphosphate deaminase
MSNEVNRYAQSDEESAQRFERFATIDPFPNILPALLNSADISDYVAATAMIYPFYEGLQKPASYEVALLGKYIYWDGKGRKKSGAIERGKEFILRKNSIAFVTLEPMFRLPEYLALRFNLKITHIYRGILLGTGPLVDPGFIGKLSVPLHNLTTNDYRFIGGDALIWMEFTKLSPRPEWNPTNSRTPLVPMRGRFYEFPEEKKSFGDVENYLRKADPHRPIRSSIPDVLESAVSQAKKARNSAWIFTAISIVALAGLMISLLSLITSTNSYLREAQKETQNVRYELENEKKKTQELQDWKAQLEAAEPKSESTR